MIVHMSRESHPKYFCAFCPKVFNRLSTKNIHERKVHTKEIRDFLCNCGKKYNSYAALYCHRKNEHSTVSIPCQHCGEKFPSKMRLRVHFIKKHKQKDTCEICGQLTPTIEQHLKLFHSARIKCTFEGCNKDFANQASLRSHIVYAHETQKTTNKCSECDAVFNSDYRLKIHVMRQHNTEKKPCKVPGCTHSTSRRAYLVMHYRNHKGIDSKEKARLIEELKNK